MNILLARLFSPAISVGMGLSTLYYSVKCIVITQFRHHREVNGLVLRWSHSLLGLAGVHVNLRGGEKCPKVGAIYVFNHTSLFDIPVLHGSLPIDFRFGAKIELFSIPFFGRAIRRGGALPIVRTDRKKVMRLYEQSIQRVHDGENFMLAPEGTRQKEPQLGNFKSGPFVFAIQAQCPVVPVVVKGAHRIIPKGRLTVDLSHERKVEVVVLDPIPTKGLTTADRDAVKTKVYELMKAEYARPEAQ
jgi:1-acyl-sn-glycerol-3-phosphate acyltransferase